MSIVDKLVSIETAKESIKSAITEKGVDLTGVSFIDYGSKISEISGGGGSVDYLEGLNELLKSTTYTSMTATVVPSHAFELKSLTSVNLPACTSVGMYAFNNCISLTYVNIPACTKVDGYAFSYCMQLTSIDLPVCTSIGKEAFAGCWSLTSVSLPVCTSISSSAFYNCSKLTSVSLPVCTSLGGSAFYKCLSLTSIDLPVCTSIEDYTFFSCMSLTSVSLPVCTSIGNNAFRFCNKLTSVNFLPNCKNIDNYAFQYCSALTYVNIPVCEKLGSMVFQYCSALTTVYLSGVSSVTSLYNSNAFSGCTALTSIYVPMSLVDAFKGSTNWTYFSDKIVGWEGLVEPEIDYMYFKLADGYTSGNVSYQFDEYYNLHNKYLKISTDGNNWSDWTEAISMTPNTKYFVKGEDSYVRNSNESVGFFTSDVSAQKFNIECGGNVMSLVNMNESITVNSCFSSLFYNMTNLLTPPALPATTLTENCYNSMFYRCSSLVKAPELPATTLANYCYSNMFNGCSSLTQAPALPATTLADSCYIGMFYGCSSLTQAPALPATTLAYYCYYNMFYNCSSLTEAPELPETTLVNRCCESMFYNCNKLNWIKALFTTTTPSITYTNYWVTGVSAKGVFVKNINATWTTTGNNAVPKGWTVIYFDKTEGKYYTTQTKEVECDKYGNVKQ